MKAQVRVDSTTEKCANFIKMYTKEQLNSQTVSNDLLLFCHLS